MTTESLVSVVTPAYNAAPYIAECIESILVQTYENWTLTVVDNASTDGTPAIVGEFAARDRRIRYLRFDEFVSATANHNRAFETVDSESEFCKVVQADDWLYPECLSRMVEAAQAAENIGIVSSYRLRGATIDLMGLPAQQTHATGREILRQSLLGGPYLTGAPTALLLRSELVRERVPFYDPGYWHADTEAAYWALTKYDFGFVHQVLTFARRQSGSRVEWADRMNTYEPEGIRFLVRYGPGVLTVDEFRARLNLQLRRYVVYHLRQSLRPSRLTDTEFFEFHLSELQSLLEEAGDDRALKATVATIRTLLLRRCVGRIVGPSA